jgi:hypothetical protein
VLSLFDNHATSERCKNKSIFISLHLKDNKFLSVCPVIPVYEGDFVGIFARIIRFSEDFNVKHGILSPVANLWLDYSQVTGTLNQMQVSQPGSSANVRFLWEAVNERDETGPCISWRVLVLATRTIMPFDELIRVAPREEQFLLHKSSEHARRGFTN